MTELALPIRKPSFFGPGIHLAIIKTDATHGHSFEEWIAPSLVNLCYKLFTKLTMKQVFADIGNNPRKKGLTVLLYTGPAKSGDWRKTNQLVGFACT